MSWCKKRPAFTTDPECCICRREQPETTWTAIPAPGWDSVHTQQDTLRDLAADGRNLTHLNRYEKQQLIQQPLLGRDQYRLLGLLSVWVLKTEVAVGV